MATLQSTAAATNASGFFLSPPKFIENGCIARSVKWAAVAAQSAGDVVQMIPIPKGATILELNANYAGLGGASLTTTIGDGNSASRYNGSISTNVNTVVRATAGVGYAYTADDTIDVVIGTATSASVGASLILNVLYQCDATTDGTLNN